MLTLLTATWVSLMTATSEGIIVRCTSNRLARFMVTKLLYTLKPSDNPDDVVNERIRFVEKELKPRTDRDLPLSSQHTQLLEDMYNGYVLGQKVKRGTNTPL